MKLIFSIFLMATVVMADPYSVIIAANNMSQAGRRTVLANIQTTGKDKVEVKNPPEYYYNSNTNIIVKVVCVRVDSLGVNNWKNITNAQIEQRLEVGLSAADKVYFDVIGRPAFLNNFTPQNTNSLPTGQ